MHHERYVTDRYVENDTVDPPRCLDTNNPDHWIIRKEENTTRERWADRLWPTMAWFIFAFNVFVSLTYCIRILTSADVIDGIHMAAMYITISITMCGTYMALMWAHYNILRKKDGLG